MLNGRQIYVSDTNELESALIATELGTARDAATFAAVTRRMAVMAEASRSIRWPVPPSTPPSPFLLSYTKHLVIVALTSGLSHP